MRAFRESGKEIAELPQNLVYAHPSVATLAQYITHAATGEAQAPPSSVSATSDMQALVDELTQDFQAHTPSLPAAPHGVEVVLVTGTTGSLGAHILNTLVSVPSVVRIYALNRPDKSGRRSVRERQLRAFEEHGIDSTIVHSSKLVLLEGDTTLTGLGVSSREYENILGSVTTIIHNGRRLLLVLRHVLTNGIL